MMSKGIIGRFLAGVFISIILLEVLLDFLPVKSEIERLNVSKANPILRGVPGSAYLYSRGWSMRGANPGTINEAGYPANRPYGKQKPSIAVIGDSYIEATMVVPGRRLQDILDQRSTIPVFGYGRAGADLGEYAAMVNWVAANWKLEALVIAMNATDVKGALNGTRGDHYYRVAEGHRCSLVATSRNDPAVLAYLKKSNLFKYVFYNLDFVQVLIKRGAAQRHGSQPTLANYRQAVGCFLDDIVASSKLEPSRILFLIDEGRKEFLYEPERDQHYELTPLSAMFAGLARNRGMGVIELYPKFRAAFLRQHARLDASPQDWHWNALGHEVVADVVCEAEVRELLHPMLCNKMDEKYATGGWRNKHMTAQSLAGTDGWTQ